MKTIVQHNTPLKHAAQSVLPSIPWEHRLLFVAGFRDGGKTGLILQTTWLMPLKVLPPQGPTCDPVETEDKKEQKKERAGRSHCHHVLVTARTHERSVPKAVDLLQ